MGRTPGARVRSVAHTNYFSGSSRARSGDERVASAKETRGAGFCPRAAHQPSQAPRPLDRRTKRDGLRAINSILFNLYKIGPEPRRQWPICIRIDALQRKRLPARHRRTRDQPKGEGIAGMKKPTRTDVTGKKRERRVAPRFRFKWSDDVWPVVRGMPAPTMEELRQVECYTRIADAEDARSDEMTVLNLYAMEGFSLDDPWWAPFEFDGHDFQLEYKDGKIREYELVFARAPLIPPGSPAWEELLKACLPSNSKSRKRGGKRRDAKGALPAAAKKHPKQTDDKREFTNLYGLNETIDAVAGGLNHSLAQSLRPFRPKLLRSVVHMKRARANIVNGANTAVTALVQLSQNIASLALRVGNSLTRARDVAVQSVGPGASLEPRCVGQNVGLPILLYSWFRDDEAIGVLPSMWPASWFGPLPEEERVFA